ncbi:DUF1758 domain-containing protein [Trichonephila clavata]|uniref:DUF1758 domain-containing protein n=1 Tax=Trichonephila clavata TaxID=2740835 RepID=A0A8X6KTM8_TRICU|nr:DUF1758 domain-containing protein [Trichonephila clavata]
MEDLIKRRSPVRANFTKRFNTLITALNEENLNHARIEIKFCSLERIATDLAECDDSICNALLDAKSKEYDEEYEKIEEYHEKLDVARICVKEYFEKLSPISELQVSVIAEKAKLKLPKIKLIKFGEPCENLTHVVFGGASSKKKHNCYELSVSNLRKNYSCKIQVLYQEIMCAMFPAYKEVLRKYMSPVVWLNCCGNLFGRSVMGRPRTASNNYSSISFFVQSHDISDLRRLETIDIMDSRESDSSKELESKAIDYFSSSVKIDEDGRSNFLGCQSR